MHVGHVQLSSRSWQSRNFIRSGPLSVSKMRGPNINTTIPVDNGWHEKHLRAIELAYRGSEYFEEYFPFLEEILAYPWSSLAELNETLIEQIMEWLDITTDIYYSEDHHLWGYHKVDMLIEMCKAVGADHYLSNEGARAYIDVPEITKMHEAGITHLWQEFTPPDYGQPKKINDGQLSIIDLLFTHGAKAGDIVKSSGSISC